MSTPKPRPAPLGVTFALALRRALEVELPQEVAEAILFNSLRLADVEMVPDDPAGFVFFVLGSLDVAIERRAGRNVADAVLQELEPLLARARECVTVSSTGSGLAPKSEPAGPASHAALTESGVHPRITSVATLPPDQPAASSAPLATLLVASADSTFRSKLRSTLQLRGHRVLAAQDGHIGLALCVRYQPDLLICDADMPRVSGKELVSSIRLALGGQAPRIIVLTPGPSPPIADVYRQIPKPVHPDVLDAVIDEALSS